MSIWERLLQAFSARKGTAGPQTGAGADAPPLAGYCRSCRGLVTLPQSTPPFGTAVVCPECRTPLTSAYEPHRGEPMMIEAKEVGAIFGWEHCALEHPRCPRCNQINYCVVFPERGWTVGWYANEEQTNPQANFVMAVHCVHCDSDFVIEWDGWPFALRERSRCNFCSAELLGDVEVLTIPEAERSLFERDLGRPAQTLGYVKDKDGGWSWVACLVCAKTAQANRDAASAHREQGLACQDRGEYDRALAHYDEAIRLCPAEATLHNDRGSAWIEKGYKKGELECYERAIADLDQAIRLNPDYTMAYMNRGAAQAGKGDDEGAIADYGQALRLDPKYAKAYYNRGNSYYRKGEYDRAVADYTRAIDLGSLDGRVSVLAYNNRGVARGKAGHYDKAIADYEEAIGLLPGFSGPYFNRARLEAMQGHTDQALKWLAEAIRRDEVIREYARTQSDFASLRDDPRFIALVGPS